MIDGEPTSAMEGLRQRSKMMTGMISSDIHTTKNLLSKIAGAFLMAVLLIVSAQAQDRTESAQTPLGMQKGAPAGSFSLSGFESVNPYSGGLNFTLPLL